MKNVEKLIMAKLEERRGQLSKVRAQWDGKDYSMELEIVQLEDEVDLLAEELEEADED